MSTAAQKSGNRTAHLRERELNNAAEWDESMPHDPTTVFLPKVSEDFLDQMDTRLAEAKLDKLKHQFIDGGLLVSFRSKRDADTFRQMMD